MLSSAKPWCCAGGVTASVRMPPCCRNPFVSLCHRMPRNQLRVKPVPALGSVGDMRQNMVINQAMIFFTQTSGFGQTQWLFLTPKLVLILLS